MKQPRQLMYPDFNSVPWPINHHAYIHAAAAALRADLPAETEPVLPPCDRQDRDIRTAHIVVLTHADRLVVSWEEFDGWTHTRGSTPKPLIQGAPPVLYPEEVTAAVRAVLTGDEHPQAYVTDQRRHLTCTVAPGFERQLAAYRSHD